MIEASGEPVQILLLAQRAADIEKIKEALGRESLTVLADSLAFIQFLRRRGEYESALRPDLLLLDLDLPDGSDLQPLLEIKEDPLLKRIPMVVLAAGDENIRTLYTLRANAYMVKPVEEREFIDMIRTTLHFWLKMARLPGD